MKLYAIRGETNLRYQLVGLLHNALEAIRIILLLTFVLGMLFAPIIIYTNWKTSDKEFCKRVQSQQAKQYYHCPLGQEIAEK